MPLYGQPAERPRPNVLLVITDDQGYGDFGLHGNPHVRTPVLDRFAREGTRFERFFVSPLCAPTRASLLTGRYSLRTGVWGVTHTKEAMRPEEVTVAEALKAAGYRTGCFGKWHNGEQFPYTPQGQGFDEFLGFHNGHWNNYFDAELLRGTEFVQTKGYIADVLTDEALRFIERNRDRPFFGYVAYNTPHSPFQVPDKYFDKYKALGLDDTLACVYGMCENVDDNVGRLLARLDELKLRENTVVLFLTDNGANTDRYNAGMRGRKGNLHEGGSLVPLFVQYPARLKQPRVVETITAHIDLYPTLLELCGAQHPKGPAIDGRSLVPLLEGRMADWPERTLFTHNMRAGEVAMFPGAARTQRYRLVNVGQGYQLFDMAADPGQTKDIAKEHPDLLKRLAAEYEAWFKDVSKAGFERFPIPVGHAEEDPVLLLAPQAYYGGGLRFFGRNGYANDWLTGWTDLAGQVYWDVDVARPGTYAIELVYLCPQEDAGSVVRVALGSAAVEATVAGTPIRTIPLPHRAERASSTYVNREWATLPVGRVDVGAGRTRLTVQALRKPGQTVMDLKAVRLRRLP
jgi:arylsulfatase A